MSEILAIIVGAIIVVICGFFGFVTLYIANLLTTIADLA